MTQLDQIKAAVSELEILYAWLYNNEAENPKEYASKRQALATALELLKPVAENKSVIVPVEPTEAMSEAGFYTVPLSLGLCLADIEDIYETMIAAKDEK